MASLVPHCRLRLTPDRLVALLLVAEALLWLSDRLGLRAWQKGYAVVTCLAVVGLAILAMAVWWALALIFRRRFQFGIRFLLVLAVAVALPCSWLAVEVKEARGRNQAVAAIRATGGSAYYAWTPIDLNDPFAGPAPSTLPERLKLRVRTRLAEVFGLDFVSDVTRVTGEGKSEYRHPAHVTCDDDLRHLRSFPELEHLDLSHTDVSNTGLREVRGLRRLQRLGLAATGVDDAGMEHLRGLTGLTALDLDETQVSDAGLECLRGLPRLQAMGLAKTRLSDAGLPRLRGFTQLRTLRLSGTRITDGGMECLRGLTGLEELDLSETRLTDAGLARLRGLTHLKTLSLSRTRVGNAGLEHLEGLQQLEQLEALEADAGEIGVARLRGKLPKLSVLFSTRLSRGDRKAIVKAVKTPQVRALFGDEASRELSIVALDPAKGGGAEVSVRVLPFHHGLVFSLKKHDGRWRIISHGSWIGEGGVEEPPVEE